CKSLLSISLSFFFERFFIIIAFSAEKARIENRFKATVFERPDAKKKSPEVCPRRIFSLRSDNDTDQPAAALVYDLFHGALQFFLTVFVDLCHLPRNTIVHQLVQRLSENVYIPDLLRISACLFPDVCNQVLRLQLCPHDRRNLRREVCADQMDGRRLRPALHSTLAAVFADLRLGECDLRWYGL